MGYSTIYRLFEIFGWLILRCLDGWTLGVDPSLKLTDFESPLQGDNLESGGSRLGRPYTKKWGKYKLPYPKFHRFCYKTVLQISHNHLLFSVSRQNVHRQNVQRQNVHDKMFTTKCSRQNVHRQNVHSQNGSRGMVRVRVRVRFRVRVKVRVRD